MGGISVPEGKQDDILTIIRSGDQQTHASSCSVNRPFIVNASVGDDEPISFEVTIGMKSKKESKMGNFSTIGLGYFHLSDDDVERAVNTPKVLHTTFVPDQGNASHHVFNDMVSDGNYALKRNQGSLIEKYFRKKRRKKKNRHRKPTNDTDNDDASVTSLETACSLDAISSSMDHMTIGDISVAKNSYVSILVEAYEKKPATEAEIFIEKVHEFLFGGGLCSAVPTVVCQWNDKTR